jgi:hypothetical protein
MGTTNPVPTDVYSSSFNGSTWATPFAVSAIAGVNEFMPALDSDAAGYENITFYSTSGSSNNAKYREWRACTACGIQNKALNSLWSDPAQYTIARYFIGDYQDGVSIRGQGYNEYVPAWVGINGSNGEIHLTDVSY